MFCLYLSGRSRQVLLYVNYFLQTAMKDREKHKIALSAYKKHVKEIEDWYDEMKVRQATTPQATDSVAELQKQLTENKVGDILNPFSFLSFTVKPI